MPQQVPNLDPVHVIGERFRDAIAKAAPDAPADADPLISPSKRAELGDFQSNAAMGLAKRLGMKPRDLAVAIVAKLDLADLCDPVNEDNIAGPGFINVRLRPEALAKLVEGLDTPGLGVPEPQEVQTVVVDLCGVNLAKQMHVGHLRATVIGDALARVFERMGHKVIRQNHVGDWGLPIAMVTAKLAHETQTGHIDPDKLTLDILDRLYRTAQQECAADHKGLEAVQRFDLGPKAASELEEQVAGAEEAMAGAKQTLIKLQSHDAQTVAVWQRLADVTMSACLAACGRLHANITQADSAGESSYAEELAGIIEDLQTRNVAEESQGALVIRNEGIGEPTLVRKSDGGFLYATTDLAGIRRRVQKFGADRVIYAVDARQSLHFKQVFASATKAGYATKLGADHPSQLEHAAFGTVLGEDHRPFKTRSGENVKLSDLIDESVTRAEAAIAEKNTELDESERRNIAEAVGIAAVKYADLSNDRVKDYVFSFDRMLAFEGNTGPYLLYAYVRINSIFKRGVERGILTEGQRPWADATLLIEQPAEKTLALELLRYPGTLAAVSDSLEPHRLCQFLYDLASAYMSFFESCPVLIAEDDATRLSRLRLCDLTARILADGLHTLGLPTLERM